MPLTKRPSPPAIRNGAPRMPADPPGGPERAPPPSNSTHDTTAAPSSSSATPTCPSDATSSTRTGLPNVRPPSLRRPRTRAHLRRAREPGHRHRTAARGDRRTVHGAGVDCPVGHMHRVGPGRPRRARHVDVADVLGAAIAEGDHGTAGGDGHAGRAALAHAPVERRLVDLRAGRVETRDTEQAHVGAGAIFRPSSHTRPRPPPWPRAIRTATRSRAARWCRRDAAPRPGTTSAVVARESHAHVVGFDGEVHRLVPGRHQEPSLIRITAGESLRRSRTNRCPGDRLGADHWPAATARRTAASPSPRSFPSSSRPRRSPTRSAGAHAQAPVSSVPGVRDSSHGIGLGGAGASATRSGEEHPRSGERSPKGDSVS